MTAIRISPRPGLFSISDYPNTTTGDDATGLRAAFAAAVASGAGGIVQLENRTYNLNTPDAVFGSNGPALVNGDNRGTAIEIRGRGRGVTILKYGTHVSSLVGFNMLTPHPTLYPVSLYDMTLDGQTSNTSLQGYIYHYSATASMLNEYSMAGITHCERVDAYGFGHSESSVRFAIRMSVNRDSVSVAQAAPMCVVRGLRVKDCDWGHGPGTTTTRGGGVGGIYLGAAVNATLGDKSAAGQWKPSRLYGQLYNPANYLCDDIVIDGLKHTSGRSPISTSAPGAPIQLGGDGLCSNMHIRGLTCENSGDIGIELDGPINALIEQCTFINGDGWGVLLLPAPGGSGAPGNDEWEVVTRDCEIIYPALDNYGSAGVGSPSGGAFSSNSRFGCWFNGRLMWENMHVRYQDTLGTPSTLISLGPAREQVLRNCSIEMLGSQSAQSLNMVRVLACGRPQTLRVENLRGLRNTPANTGVTMTDTVLQVFAANDLNLQVKGLDYTSAGLQTSPGKRNAVLVNLALGAFMPTETWSTDLLDGLLFESGASTNYTYDGTSPKTYSATSNLSTENRAMFLAAMVDSTANNVVGRVKDGGTYMQMKTGAALTGYKSGMFCARRDATSRIEGYVYDDGTTSYMCLDKVTAGTRAPLLPAAGGTATGAVTGGNLVTDTITSPPANVSAVGLALPARLGTATNYWESIIIQGDTVTFEHWASAEPGTNTGTHPAGTADAWCQATLLTTDIHAFGSKAFGEQGFIQQPQDAAAKLGKLLHRRLHVISGRIEGVHVGAMNEAAAASTGVYYNPTYATIGRIDPKLELVSSDFSNLLDTTSSATDTNFIANSLAFTQNLIRRGNRWANAIADTTVTFTSGTAWQNQTGSWGTLTVQGGTVTKIEISKDGTTYRDTGVIAGAIPVQPNWYVKVTHSGAPTAIFMQED